MSLIGTKVWKVTERTDTGTRTTNKTKGFYDQRVDIAKDLTLITGQQMALPFAIAAPQHEESIGPGPGVGKAMGVLSSTSYGPETYRWELVARYDAPGPDLQNRHRVWAGTGTAAPDR